MTTRTPARARKTEFSARIQQMANREFFDRLPLKETPDPGQCQFSTIQNDGTGPATVECVMPGTDPLIVKLFADDTGSHSYEMLEALWNDGFGDQSNFRVAEPLRFVDDLNLFAMKRAPGECLGDYVTRDRERALSGVQRAARWIARLHSSDMRRGRLDQPWYMFTKLADRLTKAAAVRPEWLKFLTSKIDLLSDAGDRLEVVTPVQTHGQYRPIHVFIKDDITTVIDLDRSRPGDPARDVAEFIHRLRSTFQREQGEQAEADRLTDAFLAEYQAAGRPLPANLPFFRGFHVLVSLCRHMKRLHPEHSDWDGTISYYTEELENALQDDTSEATKGKEAS